jgi:hypothetical protein
MEFPVPTYSGCTAHLKAGVYEVAVARAYQCPVIDTASDGQMDPLREADAGVTSHRWPAMPLQLILFRLSTQVYYHDRYILSSSKLVQLIRSMYSCTCIGDKGGHISQTQ